MRCAALGLVLASCGRFEFSPVDAGAGTDTQIDADAAVDADSSGLVVRYTMDDDPSSGVILASATGYNGTCVTCPLPAAGHLGGGYQFTGSEGVDLSMASSALVGSNPFSMTVWANVSIGAVVAKPLAVTSTSDVFALQIGSNSLYFETAHAGTPVMLTSTQDIRGSWHHVATTWDGTTKRLYIDGVLDGTAASASLQDTVRALSIGRDIDNNAPVAQLVGTLDELRFYNRELSASEVAAVAAE